MKHKVKYAALNLGVPLMLVAELMFAGAFAIGEMNRLACVVICLSLGGAIRAAWDEIQHMERAARRAKRTAQQMRRNQELTCQGAQSTQEAPKLWVA